MAGKRPSDGKSSRQPKQQRSSNSIDQGQMVQQIVELLEPKLESMVQQIVDRALRNYNQAEKVQTDQNEPPKYQIKFVNSLNNTYYTTHEVLAADEAPIEIAIFDIHTQKKIEPDNILSMAKIEIVALRDKLIEVRLEDWSTNFRKNIVRTRDESKPQVPILKGDLVLDMENGHVSFDNVVFHDNSSWTDNGRFRLGARVCGNMGERVLEGTSEAFRVKDRHLYACQKPHPPKLSDGVECLEKVGVASASKLQKEGIITVKDFLQHFYKNPAKLRKIIGIDNAHHKFWRDMVAHAKECDRGDGLFSHHVPDQNCVLFFNSVYEFVGAKFSEIYTAFDKLDPSQKNWVAEWKQGFWNGADKRDKFDYKMINNEPVSIDSSPSFHNMNHDQKGIGESQPYSSLLRDETCFISRENYSGNTKFSFDDPNFHESIKLEPGPSCQHESHLDEISMNQFCQQESSSMLNHSYEMAHYDPPETENFQASPQGVTNDCPALPSDFFSLDDYIAELEKEIMDEPRVNANERFNDRVRIRLRIALKVIEAAVHMVDL